MSSSAPPTKRKGPFGGRTVSRNPGVQRNHIGALKNIPVGAIFKGRFEASEAGIHCPLVAGIHGNAADGAYSIVLSGGYEDDVDHGDFFTYTGAGGRNKQTGEQVADQQWERGNLALLISLRNQTPIRVLRGWSGGTVYSPRKEEGYRYDGLYQVIDAYRSRGTSGYRVCRFEMVRYPYNPHTRTPHGRRLIEEVKASVLSARLGQGRDDPVERVVLTLDKDGDWLVVEEEMGYEDERERERWRSESSSREDVKPVVGVVSGESGSASAEEDGEESGNGEDEDEDEEGDGDGESELEVKPEPVDVALGLEYVDGDVDEDVDMDADVGRLRSSTPVPADPDRYAEREANESSSSSSSSSGRGGSRERSTSEDQLDCIDTDTDTGTGARAESESILAAHRDADLRCSTPRPLSRLPSIPIPTPDVRGDPYDADASASEYASASDASAQPLHPDSGESRRRGGGVRGGRVESCSADEDEDESVSASVDGCGREYGMDVDVDADGGTRIGPRGGGLSDDEVAESDMDASDTSPQTLPQSWSRTQTQDQYLSADAFAYEDGGDQPAANALASARSGKRKRSDSLDSVDARNTDEGYSTTGSRSPRAGGC